MSGGILVGGAINTDLIAFCSRAPEAGETITGDSFEIHGGGKAANQAVAVARLGAPVSLIGAVGDDDFGRTRLSDLAADGVDTTGVAVRDNIPSGVALITVERSGENRIAYIPAATLSVTPDEADAVMAAASPIGVLLPNELAPEVLRSIMESANAAQVPVIFNLAPYSDDARELVGMVDTVIANETEIAELTGHTGEDLESMIARALEMGPSSVIVTTGSRGAVIGRGESIHVVPGYEVTAVDTTGAGDTFCGAFASRYLMGEDFDEAVAWANAAAALSVTRRGAASGIPNADETRAFLASHAS